MAPPPSTPDKYPDQSAYDEIVEIQVGEPENPECKSFKVHKGIICFYSGFFASAFKPNRFVEGQTGSVTLPEEEVEVLSHFVHWLYTRKMPVVDKDMTFKAICKIWAFADRREVPLLMNECINALRDTMVKFWMVPTGQLKRIYANTTSSSGLRRLSIELIARTGGPPLLENDDWNPEALRDVLKMVWKMKKSSRLTPTNVKAMDLCEYHQHEKDVRCPSKT